MHRNEIYCFDRYDDTDVLIIKQDSHINTHDELAKSLELWKELYDNPYDENKKYTGLYSPWEFTSDFMGLDYGERAKVIYTPKERLMYLYACYYNDEAINKMVKKLLPEIKKVGTPIYRSTTKGYIRYWMKKYGFTLEEFFTDDRFIVLSDKQNCKAFRDLIFLGITNLDDVEKCSMDEAWFGMKEEEE